MKRLSPSDQMTQIEKLRGAIAMATDPQTRELLQRELAKIKGTS